VHDSDLLSARLRHAWQKCGEHFLRFDARRQFLWGFESRRAGSGYY